MAITGTTLGAATTHDVRDTLVRLLGHATDDPNGILSIYVDLDPATFAAPPARANQVASLLDDARRRAPDTTWSEPIERLAQRFRSADYEVPGAHGMACFCGPDGLFELVLLPKAPPRRVVYDRTPYLRPMISLLPRGDWLVLLANRREARLLRGTRERLDDVAELHSDVPGQHSQGGWSQANFERSIEHDVDEHLRDVAALLAGVMADASFEGLLVAMPRELRMRLRDELPTDVAESIREFIDLDVENASSDEVMDAVAAAVDRFDRRRRDELLARLRANAGIGDRAALGIDAVLDSLVAQRVETLLVADGHVEPGGVCGSCGWMHAGDPPPDGACPVDQQPLVEVEDIVEAAIEAAVLQRAHVVTMERSELEGSFDSIAAVLRY